MPIIEKNLYKSLNQKNLFETNPVIAVAVSGGPDSIALVFLLKNWIKKNKGKLIALIIDHQIRENSFKEASFVKKYLSDNNIQSLILKVPKKNILKGKMIQARENRFLKIINYCKKNKILHLFIGHHSDDNVETFVLRKIAGSNFEGLNCMQERTIYDYVQIIRPMLKFTKKQILNYNKKMNLFYVNDPSNNDEKYSRVVVRNFIKNNPQYKKNIIQEFKLIRENYYDYKKMIFQIYNLINIEIHKNIIIFDSIKFLNLDQDLQAKFTEITYKFFYPKKPFLRYKKVIKTLDKLSETVNLYISLSNMKVQRNNKLIYFIA
jgi:tRNA(Ile)-lysidine synthetase-like protein